MDLGVLIKKHLFFSEKKDRTQLVERAVQEHLAEREGDRFTAGITIKAAAMIWYTLDVKRSYIKRILDPAL
jgi:hypothetical protein